MKIITPILICLLIGCALSRGIAVSDPELYGMFCHSSLDASLCLKLRPDRTYLEDFNSSAAGIPSESRGGGRWEQKNGQVVLTPDSGPRRVLHISEDKGTLTLLEMKGSKTIRSYRR